MDRQKSKDRDLYDSDVHWLLLAGPVALGEKSTLGSVTAILENGGFPTGVPETDIYSDYQIGWCAGEGTVGRARRLLTIWRQVNQSHQAVLMAHYMPIHGIGDGYRAALCGALGEFAQAAFWLHNDPKTLAEVCHKKDSANRGKIIRHALSEAEKRVREAHRMWHTVKELVNAAA